jgi:hypothetical protein
MQSIALSLALNTQHTAVSKEYMRSTVHVNFFRHLTSTTGARGELFAVSEAGAAMVRDRGGKHRTRPDRGAEVYDHPIASLNKTDTDDSVRTPLLIHSTM